MARKKVEFRQLKALPVERIAAPPRPGRLPREEDIEALAREFAEKGQAPPVLVRDEGGGEATLVTGAATLAAVRRLGWPKLDCIVAGPEAERELKAVERMQHEGFDAWAAADAIHALKRRYGWTQTQLGQAIGKTRDFVANLLAVTQISPEVRRVIQRHEHGGALTARHLRYVARTPRSEQMRIAQRILSETVSTKSLEREKRLGALHALDPNVIRVRPLRDATGLSPRHAKDWRRYHRQLITDLRRIDRQESAQKRRALERMAESKHRLKLVRAEANRKRRQLLRELRAVQRELAKLGE